MMNTSSVLGVSARQVILPLQVGSSQSTRPSPLSSLPLSQISPLGSNSGFTRSILYMPFVSSQRSSCFAPSASLLTMIVSRTRTTPPATRSAIAVAIEPSNLGSSNAMTAMSTGPTGAT